MQYLSFMKVHRELMYTYMQAQIGEGFLPTFFKNNFLFHPTDFRLESRATHSNSIL